MTALARSAWPKRLGMVVAIGMGFILWAWLDSYGVINSDSGGGTGVASAGAFAPGLRAWRSFLGSSTRVPKGPLRRAAEAAVCPREYRRLTLDEVEKQKHRWAVSGTCVFLQVTVAS